MSQIRGPATLTINSAGAFKETQRGAIIEAAINLSVSLILFFATNLGMYGLLIGTVCSYMYRTIDVIYYVYKNVLKRKIWSFLRLFFVNLAAAVGVWFALCVLAPITAASYIEWILKAVVYGVAIAVAFVTINMLLNYRDTRSALIGVMGKLISKRIKK